MTEFLENIRDITDMGDDIFARPSFISGMGRVMDLGSTFNSYKMQKTGEEADIEATSRDWKNVGKDLAGAIASYKKKHK